MIDNLASLTQAELNELADFLVSDETPEVCMDISMLDGFMTSLVIGPETVMPSRWMPVVWGESEDDPMEWKSTEKANHILGLMLKLFNSIVDVFENNPESFGPIFYMSKNHRIIIADWCEGFMTGIRLSIDAWKPFMEDSNHEFLLSPIFLHGTEEGHALLKSGKIGKYSSKHWSEIITDAAKEIHNYWLPFRLKAYEQSVLNSKEERVGRNDPCPCGSGKKFKNCCMN